MNKKLTPIWVKVSPEIKEKLQMIADKEDRSLSSVIRRLLEKVLADRKQNDAENYQDRNRV